MSSSCSGKVLNSFYNARGRIYGTTQELFFRNHVTLLSSCSSGTKISSKRKFWAGYPSGHPAKNFGQAIQILGKQAFRHGQAVRMSMQKLRSEKDWAGFLFPSSLRQLLRIPCSRDTRRDIRRSPCLCPLESLAVSRSSQDSVLVTSCFFLRERRQPCSSSWPSSIWGSEEERLCLSFCGSNVKFARHSCEFFRTHVSGSGERHSLPNKNVFWIDIYGGTQCSEILP